MSEGIYEQIPDEAIPKYCPNCGEKLVRVSKKGLIWIMPMGDSYQKTHLKITTFDTYCDECEWSGNISPDVPEDIIVYSKEARKE
jgi:hypothetical protein